MAHSRTATPANGMVAQRAEGLPVTEVDPTHGKRRWGTATRRNRNDGLSL